MKKTTWLIGLAVTLIVILVPILIFLPKEVGAKDDPWANVPVRPPHVDHTHLMTGPYETGQDVTRACLECHEDAAFEVMQTVHWTWESQPYQVEGRSEPITVGKKNSLNNYCIGIRSNWPSCTICHAGYGWSDDSFDFSNPENVDCLVCHVDSGIYAKAQSGLPAEGTNLVEAAQSVGLPSRENCGSCHFTGGGGNGVKHGDLDGHLIHPSDDLDVHMGREDFLCVDCHWTEEHLISGRALSVSLDKENQIYCTDCHNDSPHEDDRINIHTQTVACQTCHIPYMAVKDPTKTEWDWSTAGQDLPENHYKYLKIKGSFVYEKELIPEYYWYDGVKNRYIMGDVIDPNEVTTIVRPYGDINNPNAKIFPFKVHRANQPYDKVYNYLLQPKTAGEGGFWTEFDWDQALTLGSETTGLPYSGQYGFTETEMFWPISHMVEPVEYSLICEDCHSPNGRLDWLALGYPGDPIEWGGRFTRTP